MLLNLQPNYVCRTPFSSSSLSSFSLASTSCSLLCTNSHAGGFGAQGRRSYSLSESKVLCQQCISDCPPPETNIFGHFCLWDQIGLTPSWLESQRSKQASFESQKAPPLSHTCTCRYLVFILNHKWKDLDYVQLCVCAWYLRGWHILAGLRQYFSVFLSPLGLAFELINTTPQQARKPQCYASPKLGQTDQVIHLQVKGAELLA